MTNHQPPVRMPAMPEPPEVRVFKNEKQIHPVPPPMRVGKPPSPPSRFWCFFGVHKYEIKDESTWQITDNGQVLSKGPMYILRCPVCGKMKAERLGRGK